MNKIIVIGCPGSGKTTFARQLGQKLFIAVHHLDTYYWKDLVTKTPQEEFLQKQRELLEGDKWIIDGNYIKTIGDRITFADTIIFFDISKKIILWRFFKQLILTGRVARADKSFKSNLRVTFKFIRLVLKYPTERVYQLLEEVSEKKKVIIFHSPQEAELFLTHLL